MSEFDNVQTLVLRPPKGPAVRHIVLRVEPGRGGEALRLLRLVLFDAARKDFCGLQLAGGPYTPSADEVQCSIGFTYLGLQALCMPSAYLRVFSRLAPAFASGAPLRANRVGDSGPSAPARWDDDWRLDNAHVVLTLHGPAGPLDDCVGKLSSFFKSSVERQKGTDVKLPTGFNNQWVHAGKRLESPKNQQGEWVHFGYRDGLSEPRIAGLEPSCHQAGSTVVHAKGEFLLGYPNNIGVNRFGLPTAPAEVRNFYRDSSFGVLRQMEQNVSAFEAAVDRWRREAELQLRRTNVSRDWIKAKLCGRWPSGEALRPDQWEPVAGDFKVDYAKDIDGEGCPFSSHVRRMNPSLKEDAADRVRPLLRRGVPYGPALWDKEQVNGNATGRGLIGLFFCSSLEDQYEYLLGQWADRKPSHVPVTEGQAKDPLTGQHEDSAAGMQLTINKQRQQVLHLTGFAPWTTTLGSLYAWHPSLLALERLLAGDGYIKPKGEPWT